MNFNRNVNLIHNCISFFPSLLYKKIIKYSKKYQAKGNINLSDYIISPPFRETIIPTHSMDLYYNYYIYKYPLLSASTVNNLLIDYFKSYSLHSVITISSSGKFSKELLFHIDNNIHLYVNTNHFLKDNFSIKNNTNVIALTLNLSRYSSESIKYICSNIINNHIKSLTLISEFKIKDERANELYSSLLNCNLDLESLTLKRTPYSQCIENSKEYKTNLEDLDLLIYEQVTGDSISEEDEYSIASSLFDFIKKMKHLKVMNIYGYKIISIYKEKIKNAIQDINLEEYYYKIKNEDGTEEKHKKDKHYFTLSKQNEDKIDKNISKIKVSGNDYNMNKVIPFLNANNLLYLKIKSGVSLMIIDSDFELSSFVNLQKLSIDSIKFTNKSLFDVFINGLGKLSNCISVLYFLYC